MFQAERAAAARARRDADAAREFAENAEFFKNTETLAAKDRAFTRYKRELAFMYQKPPGFDAALEREKAEKAKAAARDAEAARGAEETAARVAAGLPPLSAEQIARRKKRKMRRDADGRNVAAADAFPELAGAPRVAPRGGGGDADGVGARPLGVQIRSTQCLRCGGFGHASGDCECPMRAHNPNEKNAFRAKTEDPLALIRAREALASSRKFQLARAARVAGRSPTRGGVDPSAANQQLLLGDDAYGDAYGVGDDADDEGAATTAERPFAGGKDGDDGAGAGGLLASLPREERRRLIREFKAREKKARRAEVAAAEAFLRGQGVTSAEARGDRKAKREKREKKDKEKRRRLG